AGRIFNKQKTLAYVSAGLAKAKIERTWLDFDYSESESHSNWQSGWTAGVGVEHKYNDNFSVRAELMHSDYGNQTVDASQWDEYYSTDLTENSLILGFSYSF
ncbi:MAG: porin family protein, partial [Amphritea sp.]|nr:porin family protein [Amphritea sp.]